MSKCIGFCDEDDYFSYNRASKIRVFNCYTKMLAENDLDANDDGFKILEMLLYTENFNMDFFDQYVKYNKLNRSKILRRRKKELQRRERLNVKWGWHGGDVPDGVFTVLDVSCMVKFFNVNNCKGLSIDMPGSRLI